jgi:uncharacterized repeat protein (TIGR03803 family)
MGTRKSPRVEAVESRVLLSAYMLGPAGYLAANDGGAKPQSTLAADAGGNFYGTASTGGAYGAGTVFEIAIGSNAITALAAFNGTNGAAPLAGVTLDPAENLFGTTSQGGAYNAGTAFEIAKGSGAVTVLASFNGANGSGPQAAVTLDGAGNLFGTTYGGGANGDGTVFEIAAGSGAITTLASLAGANGSFPAGAVTLDASGNLYGTTYSGGANNDGTVFEIAGGSNAITTIASFDGTGGRYPLAGVARDSSGNLFGTTSSEGGNGAFGLGTVFEIAAGSTTITTLAVVYGGASTPKAGVTLDAAGNLYGTTSAGGAGGYGTVFEIASGSTALTTLASFPFAVGATPEAGVTFDASGNLFGTTFAGGANNTGSVFELASGSGTVTAVASFAATAGWNPDGRLTLDASGNLYGTTYYGGAARDGTVFEIARGSTAVTTLAAFDGTNGSGPQGGLVMDAAGNLYGATGYGGANSYGTLFEIAAGSGTITTLADFNSGSGPGSEAAITLDAAGNLYGTTAYGGMFPDGVVFKIAKGSNTITVLAAFTGSNGLRPFGGVTPDAAGNLYGTTFGDGASNKGTVFEIAAGSNAITTIAVFNGTNGSNPWDAVTLDASGNLYGTTQYGGPANDGTVFEIARGSNAITTVASFDGIHGASPLGRVAFDIFGNLYGTTSAGSDSGAGTVFEIAHGSTALTTLTSFSDALGYEPHAGVTVDSLGNLYGMTTRGGLSQGGEVFKLTPNTAVALALTNGSNPSNANQSLAFTATVSGGVPDGETVALLDASNNNTVVATGTLSGGSASLVVPAGALAVGTHNVFAAYAGDPNFAASESATYAQVVQFPPPALVGAPVINGDDPHGLFTAAGQPAPGVQRSMVQDIVYTFNEPVTLSAKAFTMALAGQMTGTLPSALSVSPVRGTNNTQWAVGLAGRPNGQVSNGNGVASIANGEYSITINPAYVVAAGTNVTMAAGETDTFYRLFGDINGDRVVNLADEFQFSKAMNTYNPAFDYNGDGTVNLADEFQASKSFSSGGFVGDGFVTTI